MAQETEVSRPQLTPKALLNLCNLSKENGDADDARKERLETLKAWHESEPKRLYSLLLDRSSVDPKTGCFPLHWAAGTAFDEAISFLLSNCCEKDGNAGEKEASSSRLVDQLAVKPSTGRTPLHYAARNGHLSTCQLLIEVHQANPNPKCHRGSVTPLQLAVWQNRLEIVEYLARDNSPLLLECNDFACGLNHWIGLIPKKRWLSKDGTGVLPLARYLHEHGVSYASIPENQQNQGHTPLHKAAWGGNVALLEYFCREHGVYDSLQDAAGNYAADLAQMGSQTEAREWLHQHGSLARQESCDVLGLPVTATNEEIQARWKVLARQYHPDKLEASGGDAASADDSDFVRIKAAYDHLIHQGGAGSQRNPKHEALRLLTMAKEQETSEQEDDDDLFHARILAIISDYAEKGFPISSIARRWNQIWPDRPFPSPENYIIQVSAVGRDGNTIMIPKKVRLLKFLKWKCQAVVIFRKIDNVELAFQRSPKEVQP